jgi:AcrR family transcriptional regulator
VGINERKQREKNMRRKLILQAAEKVFFSHNGGTMDDVAQKAELCKGTLYLYFSNKDELLQALASKGIQ